MKKIIALLLLLCLLAGLLCGCSREQPEIVATTLPVFEFTTALCRGTDITVGQLVTENVSCLHDYTLQVSQMKMIESASVVVISGAGLEAFLNDALVSATHIIDSSVGCHVHEGEHHDHHEHEHENDPHIWLAPENAQIMAANISNELSALYPQYSAVFANNLSDLTLRLEALQSYGEQQLQALSTREMITFHDGFGYFAEAFDLTILEAIEEESGSEASAQELKELILLVNEHTLPAVFTEINGSVSAADVICAESRAKAYPLDMAMAGQSYFDAMYHNIDTVKEALE